MATTPSTPFGALPASFAMDLPGSADVNAATKQAGLAFGKLIETTGLAVADSQRQLNDVGAASTTALAAQLVDVIAAQVNAFDDDGNLDATGSKTITQKLPLINFIDPVFYEWAQVRLQGLFFASEFDASTETSTSSAGVSVSASNSGIGFLLGAGKNSFTFGTRGSSSDVDTSVESSFGHIRASALLQPKTDIGVPKPRQLIDAPSLAVISGADADVATEPGVRRKKATIQCNKRDGSAQDAGKLLPLSIEVTGALWAFDPTVAGDEGKTETGGGVRILLKRVLPVPAGATVPDTTPVDVTVVARLGIVSSTTVMRI